MRASAYQNGAFQIEDTSTNGVFVNSTDNRLARGQLYTLKSGDRIFIDPYEIRATITSAPRVAAADPFGLDDPFGGSVPAASPASPLASLVPDAGPLGDEASGEVDPLSLLGLEGKKTPPSERPARR